MVLREHPAVSLMFLLEKRERPVGLRLVGLRVLD